MRLPGGRGNMANRIDLDALIGNLRQELDRINQAILELERIALAKGAGAGGPVRRNFPVPVGKRCTKHRVRQD